MIYSESIFISLGSNVDCRRKYLGAARFQMVERRIRLIRKSQIYQTDAWGVPDQPPFLNQVVEIETDYPPGELLRLLKSIEVAMGRKSRDKWTEREIDLDILYYGQQVVNTADLIIPHPHLYKRNFVLVPLCEIASDFIDPVNKKTIRQILDDSQDHTSVELYKAK